MLYFFFFKQKTAYEMRISDWSSDVCSSDLRRGDEETDRLHLAVRKRAAVLQRQHHRGGGGFVFADEQAGFGGGDMDARALDRVDRLDRARQVGFARRAQRLALDRAARPHGERRWEGRRGGKGCGSTWKY